MTSAQPIAFSQPMAFSQRIALFASVSRLHIAAIGALGTFTFGWLFLGHHPWLLAGISALDWFLVNLLNRVVDLREDRENGIVGTDFVSQHRRAIVVGGFALLAASLVAGWFVAPEITLLRVGAHVLAMAYNWPLLPGGRRIKQLYFWKNTASATGFLITVFAYPLASVGWGLDAARLAPGITPLTVALSLGFFILFELSYEVIYDLRDTRGDAMAEVRSYAVVHGERGAVKIIDGLIGVSMAFLVIGYAAGAVPWRILIMLAAPLLQLLVYKSCLKRGIRAADCIGLTWLGAGLLAGYHVWIALGLPGVGAPA